jgi:hypothetical protein
MYKPIRLYDNSGINTGINTGINDEITSHLINIDIQPEINHVHYNYCNILTMVAAIVLVMVIFALFITGTLCSINGETESIECYSAGSIFNIFKTIIGIGLFN